MEHPRVGDGLPKVGEAENSDEQNGNRYRERYKPNATYHGPILRSDEIEDARC